jgi:hypothetical protein
MYNVMMAVIEAEHVVVRYLPSLGIYRVFQEE